MAKEVAIAKRAKISKANRNMLIAVCGAAIVLGGSAVGAIWCIKVMGFNGAVLTAQDEVMADYEKSIVNAGICPGVNGKISGALKDCAPSSLNAVDLPDTLRYRIMVEVVNNEALESVGREALRVCFNAEGEKIDFVAKLDEVEDEIERAKLNDMVRMCSALRVIPDALPSVMNEQALLASLNYILLKIGVPASSIDGIRPGNDTGSFGGVVGLSSLPVDLVLKGSQEDVYLSMKGMELSIRTFDLRQAVVEWRGDRIEMTAKGVAYYTAEVVKPTRTRTVEASKGAKK